MVDWLEARRVGLLVRQRAERREAQPFVAQHVEAAERHAEREAEARPQRLDVAHGLEVAPDLGAAPAVLIIGQFVVAASLPKRRVGRLRRLHPRHNRVVRTLDAREIDEARRAADQRPAGEGQLGHGLPAARGNRARAVGQAFAALEHVADHRMGLELLELVEWRERRVGIVEMHDEADRHQVVAVVVEERTAAGAAPQRPAEAVLNEARLEARRLDLPDLLEPDAVFLRIAAVVELETRDKLFRQRAARPFRDQGIFAAQLHAARERVFRLAVASDAHVAGRDADHFALVAIKHFRRREARIDLDAERLGMAT